MIKPLFKSSSKFTTSVFLAATPLLLASAAGADDGIFPAAPAAKATIDFDGRGFLVNGKRTFIASGSLHYSRVPRALWRGPFAQVQTRGYQYG